MSEIPLNQQMEEEVPEISTQQMPVRPEVRPPIAPFPMMDVPHRFPMMWQSRMPFQPHLPFHEIPFTSSVQLMLYQQQQRIELQQRMELQQRIELQQRMEAQHRMEMHQRFELQQQLMNSLAPGQPIVGHPMMGITIRPPESRPPSPQLPGPGSSIPQNNFMQMFDFGPSIWDEAGRAQWERQRQEFMRTRSAPTSTITTPITTPIITPITTPIIPQQELTINVDKPEEKTPAVRNIEALNSLVRVPTITYASVAAKRPSPAPTSSGLSAKKKKKGRPDKMEDLGLHCRCGNYAKHRNAIAEKSKKQVESEMKKNEVWGNFRNPKWEDTFSNDFLRHPRLISPILDDGRMNHSEMSIGQSIRNEVQNTLEYFKKTDPERDIDVVQDAMDVFQKSQEEDEMSWGFGDHQPVSAANDDMQIENFDDTTQM